MSGTTLCETGDPGGSWGRLDVVTRHNLLVETLFSAFNGVYMGLAIIAAPVVAVTGVRANPLELTILVSAFPVGAFLGPLWAALGRRWGMRRLVVGMAICANLPLFLVGVIPGAAWFTALLTLSQLLNSAMRMGQSSLYFVVYARELRGRVLGRLTFWNFLTMVPTVLATGWLLDKSPEFYRVLYPLGGLCGLLGCLFYRQLHVPRPVETLRTVGLRDALAGIERVLAADRAYALFQAAFFLAGSSVFLSTHVVLLLVRERFRFGAFELALWLSVVPQLLLAVGSPWWGRVLDRVGMLRCRLLITLLLTAYLACYFLGIWLETAWLIYLASLLQGTSNGGGQLTWYLASSHFAPRGEDVPMYNGIHFVLNGLRGLLMPWAGSVLFVFVGPWAVLVATLTALASVPLVLQGVREEEESTAPVRPSPLLSQGTGNGPEARGQALPLRSAARREDLR
jgi:MFS family permease